jgi:hypothetical protein
MTAREAYDQVCFYTLAHGDPAFIHQHVVDAFAAQEADERTKPVGLTMALVGLHLHVDKGWTGRQVQQAHMTLAKSKRAWPTWSLPADRGAVTVHDVLKAPEGPGRDRAIDSWCASVWEAFDANRFAVAALLKEAGVA